MKDEKQAALAAIQQINAVDGFDPSPLAVEYADLNTHEKRLRLPVMGQLAWFWLKHPEGRVAVTVTPAKECFIATARIYANYTNPSDQYLAEATASRGYLPVSRRFPPREWAQTAESAGRCSTLALDSSSLRPATPLICQQWMN